MTTPMGFDTYLCSRCDAIDNAAYALANAISKNACITEKLAYARDIAVALTVDTEKNRPLSLDGFGMLHDIVERAEKVLDGLDESLITDDSGNLEWSMSYIGEIADCVADIVAECGFDVCYPYYEGGENTVEAPSDVGDGADKDAGLPCYRGHECPVPDCPMRRDWGIII